MLGLEIDEYLKVDCIIFLLDSLTQFEGSKKALMGSNKIWSECGVQTVQICALNPIAGAVLKE